MVRNRTRQNGLLGLAENAPAKHVPDNTIQHAASVKYPRTTKELDSLLASADRSCAIIFFTSSTCGPCKALYGLYDQLAAEAGCKAVLIKVDTHSAYAIAARYSVRSTPTFFSFLRGEQENTWSGGGSSTLRGNLNLLLQMAWPAHIHESLRLPTLRGANTRAVLYTKVPPLDKLMAKMGEPSENPAIRGVKNFVSARTKIGAAEATLPDLDAFSWFLRESISKLPPDIIFTVVDLLRVALADPRFSGYFAEEKDHKTIAPLLTSIIELKDCPYALRLVTLQMACNLFSSPLYLEHIMSCEKLRGQIVQLITTSLLDDTHHNVRVAAASLSFNIAVENWKLRTGGHRDGLPEGDQVELAASLLEAIGAEEVSAEALNGFLLAFGYLVFCAPKEGELVDLLKSMDAQGTVLAKRKVFKTEKLIKEIGEELLGKGL